MVNDGIKGNTYGVEIDTVEGYVRIAGSLLTDNLRETYLFNLAYMMGRDHKKIQIREALGI
jgi:hypothetical protein